MTLYFSNNEPLNLLSIELMGVSVKVNENPIGFFGTGLKYAIAVLLRTDHKITLRVDNETYKFGWKVQNFRGTEVKQVYMNDKALGFTTELGKNWQVWMAYRELVCNTRDEGGTVSSTPVSGARTVFEISGPMINLVHAECDNYFLSTEPIIIVGTTEVHPNPLGKKTVFYRGVAASEFNKPSKFLYNLKGKLELTEDRTIKHTYFILNCIADIIVTSHDKDFIYEALTARNCVESELPYADCFLRPSNEFIEVVKEFHTKVPYGALKLWFRHGKSDELYKEAELSAYEEKQLKQAFKLLRRVKCNITRNDFTVVSGLEEGTFASVRDGKILIADRTFDMGHRFTASTLYEEWLHKEKGLNDCERDMQNFLFERLFAFVEELMEVEGGDI